LLLVIFSLRHTNSICPKLVPKTLAACSAVLRRRSLTPAGTAAVVYDGQGDRAVVDRRFSYWLRARPKKAAPCAEGIRGDDLGSEIHAWQHP
jgi:hypothetical protein